MPRITVEVTDVPEILERSLKFYLNVRLHEIPFRELEIEAVNPNNLKISWANGHSAQDGREMIAAFVAGWYAGRDALLADEQKHLESQRVDCPSVSEIQTQSVIA